MARRKKATMGDSDDSSASDHSGDEDGAPLNADEAAERDLFRNPYGGKKRKRGSMWDEDEMGEAEDDVRPTRGLGPQARAKGPKSTMRHHKVPTFVASSTQPAPTDAAPDSTAPPVESLDTLAEGASDDSGGSSDEMDVSEGEEAPEPAAAAPSESFGGAGLGARPALGGIGSRPGLGGIGSTAAPASSEAPARPKVSFMSGGGATRAAKPATQLTADEKRRFGMLQREGGLGFKLLSKMGWTADAGLGADGRGIVAPIEAKLRPKGFGVGAGGLQERTKQSLVEAKRRGEIVSDDEDTKKANKRKGKRATADDEPRDRSEAWRQPAQARKVKTVYRTYEEIVKEAGDDRQVEGGVGQIVDLTGASLPSLTSTLSIHGLGPNFDTSRLPELRHNIRYILDTAKGELDTLAREAKTVEERRRWLDGEERRTGARVATESTRIARLQQINLLVNEIDQASKLASAALDLPLAAQLAHFADPFDRLATGFVAEYQDFALDEVVIGALTPLLRRAWVDWQPLAEPSAHVDELSRYRKALRLDLDPEALGDGTVRSAGAATRTMTAYESLMWSVWLPKVRSAINSWTASDPSPAIALVRAWTPLLPRFLRDNVLDQLILPKVARAVSEWQGKRSSGSLHSLVLPWLEIAGENRMDEILQEARRRLRGYLRTWRVRDGLPDGFDLWRAVFGSRDWDELMLAHVLPQLGLELRDRFVVDPRDQKVEPLERVLAWRSLLRPAMIGQLLEAEFFPKWLEALYTWLTHEPNFDQVAEWYSHWKSWFAPEVVSLPAVVAGFGKGLDLMNKAISLGDDAKYRLKRPDLRPSANVGKPSAAHKAIAERLANGHDPVATSTISFRTIVEEQASRNNLLVMPTGGSHPATGQAIYRVSKAPGARGLSIYLRDDVVFAQSGERFEPVAVEEMIARALKL